MAMWMYQVMNALGQAVPQAWDDVDGKTANTATPAPRALSLRDFKQSMRTQMDGGSNNDVYYRKMLLVIVVAVVLIGLLLHWRQRRKSGGPPDNVGRLGRELSRVVRYPFGSRMFLRWVSWTTRVPVAVLLISGEMFDASVANWSKQPTFGAIREWGARKLKRLRGNLFDD